MIALGSFVAVHAKDSLCLASSGTATRCTPADIDCLTSIAWLVDECSNTSCLTIVIDGLYSCQSSDTSANHSNSSASIESFVQHVTNLVGSREVLYVLEPHVVSTWSALSKSSQADEQNSFSANMEMAVKSLSSNSNAQLFLGLGSTLPESDTNIASLLDLFSAGTLQGVVLNGLRGNSVKDIAKMCSNFRQEYHAASAMSCVIDTSTVVATTSSSSSPASWIAQSAECADVVSPTTDTGLENIAYFAWLTRPDGC